MKLFQGEFGDVALVLDLGLVVGFIDKAGALKKGRHAQRVAHRRNQYDARH